MNDEEFRNKILSELKQLSTIVGIGFTCIMIGLICLITVIGLRI